MTVDLSNAVWRKSRRSQTNGACVEVADLAGQIAVRDSKDPDGPALVVAVGDWRSFLTDVRREG